MATAALHLDVWVTALSVCRLPPGASVPEWTAVSSLCSITRTPEELSIVCDAALVPPGFRAEGPFRALVVRGPLDFSLTGILASIAQPLAEAALSIFAISTYDTDYVLLRTESLPTAVEVLRAAGHHVSIAGPPAEG